MSIEHSYRGIPVRQHGNTYTTAAGEHASEAEAHDAIDAWLAEWMPTDPPPAPVKPEPLRSPYESWLRKQIHGAVDAAERLGHVAEQMDTAAVYGFVFGYLCGASVIDDDERTQLQARLQGACR